MQVKHACTEAAAGNGEVSETARAFLFSVVAALRAIRGIPTPSPCLIPLSWPETHKSVKIPGEKVLRC